MQTFYFDNCGCFRALVSGHLYSKYQFHRRSAFCLLKPSVTDLNMDHRPSNRVWIGNIEHDVTLDLLFGLVRKFGEITSITMLPKAGHRMRRSAFVNFLNVNDAVVAFFYLRSMRFSQISGREILNVSFKPALVRISLSIVVIAKILHTQI